MQLKIKSLIVNRNNLALLGGSQVQEKSAGERTGDKNMSFSHASRLKSLSQERNIKKIIRMIDSPSHTNCTA